MADATDSTIAPIAHTPTRRDLLKATPIAAAALALPAAASATSNDARIIAAWDRRVAAYRTYNSTPVSDVDDDKADENFWPVIDECDRIINQAMARTPRGAEIQLWVGLHNSSAYTSKEEAAILAMDVVWIERNHKQFDWDTQSILAAIRSLRSMESR